MDIGSMLDAWLDSEYAMLDVWLGSENTVMLRLNARGVY